MQTKFTEQGGLYRENASSTPRSLQRAQGEAEVSSTRSSTSSFPEQRGQRRQGDTQCHGDPHSRSGGFPDGSFECLEFRRRKRLERPFEGQEQESKKSHSILTLKGSQNRMREKRLTFGEIVEVEIFDRRMFRGRLISQRTLIYSVRGTANHGRSIWWKLCGTGSKKLLYVLAGNGR